MSEIDTPEKLEKASAPKEQWGTRIGVILAVAGSAVGLGNFLRFPGQVASNGGGAFMLPYFIALLVIGIPLCWAEWTMGRYGGLRGFNSAPGIYHTIWRNPLSKFGGTVALLIPLIIYMYYVLIEAWCLGYALDYLFGSISDKALVEEKHESYGNYLGHFIGAGEDGALFSSKHWTLGLILLFTFSLNFALIYRGVTKGIEMFCRFAMPAMVVLAIIVLIRVLTLSPPEGHPEQTLSAGLGFMWNPQPDKLADPQTWLAAAGQVFFSLSVGFGVIINYASYLSKKDDVVLSGLTSSSMNEFFEVVLGGLITIPAAFIFIGLTVQASVGSTFGLGFAVLPNVFAEMPAGWLFGFAWFFMLFIAAVTSSVSMLQPVIAFLEEGFGLKRHASAAILGLITALGCGFVAWFSKGTAALDTLDFWVGTFMLYVLAMFQVFIYGWVMGIEKAEVEAHRGAHIRIPKFVQYMLKYVTPVYLLVIFGAFCYSNLLGHYGSVEAVVPVVAEEEANFTVTDTDDKITSLIVKQGEAADPSAKLDGETLTIALGSSKKSNTTDALTEALKGLGEDEGRFSLSTSGVEEDASLSATLGTYKAELAYEQGMIEKIANSPVTIASVVLIFLVFAFLLIMVQIAHSRWNREGRFDNLDELDDDQKPVSA